MSRYIDADKLHDEIYELTKFKRDPVTGDAVMRLSMKISEVLRQIDEQPSVDVLEILEHSEICGYNFKEFTVFAEACQNAGITEEGLKDFYANVESAYNYIMDKIEEQFEREIGKISKGGEEA